MTTTMTLSRSRFAFALRELGPGNWERFEQLASTFLSGDFDHIRTMASPSGDRGRDAQLFTTSEPTTFLQYSVTKDWKTKIRETAKRIREEFPDASLLVYVTNQTIGAEVDDLRGELRQVRSLHLDVRDHSWFLERMHKDRQREMAAVELAREVVDPIVAGDGLIDRRPSPLTSLEQRAAVVHLDLQWANEKRDKGLTKTAFEALIRSVLRDTDANRRMGRDDVKKAVRALLPSHDPNKADRNTERALEKLSTRPQGERLIRHWQKQDEFCLSHEERIRLDEHLIEADLQEQALRSEIEELIADFAVEFNVDANVDKQSAGDLVERSRRVLEAFLLGRGEAFVSAVRSGQYEDLDFRDLQDLVIKEMNGRTEKNASSVAGVIEKVVREVVTRPGEATRRHLKGLVDAYTLLAFLRETSDVQSFVQKMFSSGEIWLDTSLLLPLLSERLVDEDERQYTALLAAAREAGLQFFLTDGVLEELERQINKAKFYSVSTGVWEGSVPFLYVAYITAGQTRDGFHSWLDEFMGSERAMEDLAEFIVEEYGIQLRSLADQVARAQDDLRHAVQEAWIEVHEKRRSAARLEEHLTRRLANHDVENYLGVIVHRSGTDNHFGYTSWWMTLDRAAHGIEEMLGERLGRSTPRSPVMSPDFLSSYLAFGPVRQKLSKDNEQRLPITLSQGMTEYFSPEVLAEAERIRQDAANLSGRRLRRRLRDGMDKARRRIGDLTKSGLRGAVSCTNSEHTASVR
ncbi:MAG: hypothetical protein P4L85_01930 [Paludisphaera borealis]|uniref:hypothetical protein n=1 Tax=Paludisphaera borealis TaxID=1387353 RepID=UPI00284A9198|nr:hypothetical protein [Paludisphaera borealis]MDR3618080.1 hypothetical protein [Paludisphaera borealis]